MSALDSVLAEIREREREGWKIRKPHYRASDPYPYCYNSNYDKEDMACRECRESAKCRDTTRLQMEWRLDRLC